jgi:integrase
LKLALKDAIREEVLFVNACDGADRPRVDRKTVNPPSVAGAKAILAEAANTPYGPLIEFATRTGARRGEIIALKWNNVNLENCVVSITESAVRVKGQGQIVNPTKTVTSRRGISLDSATVAMLLEHRATQNKYIMEHRDVYTDNGYVFASPLGGMFDLDRTSQSFKRIAVRAGYPDIHLHAMRHFHATALIATGAHPRVVSERLGHASTAFTLATYGHLAAGLQEQAAEKVAELMSNG